MGDARSEIGKALDSRLSPEQIAVLLDEVLAISKQARGWCPGCKKQVQVVIPDAKAVTGALIDLANQAWGRPDVAAQADEDRIVFKRLMPVEKPLLETPNGVPAGWAVEVSGEGVPRLVKMEPEDE